MKSVQPARRSFRTITLPLAGVVVLSLFVSGCASKTTASGGKETNILGGAVAVSTNSFQPPTPTTLDVDTSKIVGKGNPSGKKVSLFWGLITLNDY